MGQTLSGINHVWVFLTFDIIVFQKMNVGAHISDGSHIHHHHVLHFGELLLVEPTSQHHLARFKALYWHAQERKKPRYLRPICGFTDSMQILVCFFATTTGFIMLMLRQGDEIKALRMKPNLDGADDDFYLG